MSYPSNSKALSPSQARRNTLLFFAGFVALLISLYLGDPENALFFPFCPVYALTGLYCPGCGSMRALHHLLHGDIAGALTFNPLLVIALPFLSYLFARETLPLLFGRRSSYTLRPALIWLIIGALILFTVLRNIPVYPFSWLAPG
jgi:hypothetical protein